MTDGHDHGSAAHAVADDGVRRRLLWSFWLLGTYFLVELVAGLRTNSLALLSDAGHMFTDVLGIGMALAASSAARRADLDSARTFGLYRLEILAALANAVLLFAVALWILVEAVGRFGDPPDVLGTPMLVVAVIGLAVNLLAFWWLRPAAQSNLNVEGAYLEVLADTLGSVGVIGAALLIRATDLAIIDPIVGVVVGVFVLPRTWRLGARALRILLQEAPAHVDVDAITIDLTALQDVDAVHDLHVWTLTSGMEVASVHLRLGAGSPPTAARDVLDRARVVLADRHGLHHATVQVEPAEDDCDDGTTW